jgi:putative ABC transport system substrate-binding protein
VSPLGRTPTPQPEVKREDTILDRRAFVTLVVGLLAGPDVTSAQPTRRAPHVGLLFPLSRQVASVSADALEAGLRELGYIPGENITLEYRWAEGHAERLPSLAAELAGSKPDVIVTVATQATVAAKAVTTTIPLVMVSVGDPVGTGIVSSLARPGGNVTGVGVHLEEFSAKLPELLKEAVPRASRVAVLADPSNLGYRVNRAIHDTARTLGLKPAAYDARTLDELQAAFSAMVRDQVNALVVPLQVFTYQHRDRIATLAAKHKLPAIYGGRAFVDAGGLMCYGVSEAGVFRRAAYYVDRILKGARPADLPVEQPTTFELVVNLKTAKELGLTLPRSLLLRADEVIR